ncbi:uncharacterized protein LOC126850861 [Cataglyphis hispanica]|uniref:uncharacterized protein LOC126850861 n=1 Tax=Cataglyphis hispanica TaxID=1086592 RepID=UPI00217F7F14|nr:uncharacterized protein LOC126850861 [Cataglyphis hispanica]XP_050450224.1 uncharacterized protein LOC126850861 [Cataglyphis hispanica]
MSQIMSGIMEKKNALQRKPTLARRVSDMFKDGNYSSPPMLFRHASMQKIRHCCQNLNLLLYLLYSFDNSKSHPIALKMHVSINRFLREITITLLVAYENLRQLISLSEIRVKEPIIAGPNNDLAKFAASFGEFQKPKRKPHPMYLVAAMYLVPLLLGFQMVMLCSLTILGKYTPGFIFLIAALLFLGGIALKILLHSKCERKKVQ